jgi:hypothetical protein
MSECMTTDSFKITGTKLMVISDGVYVYVLTLLSNFCTSGLPITFHIMFFLNIILQCNAFQLLIQNMVHTNILVTQHKKSSGTACNISNANNHLYLNVEFIFKSVLICGFITQFLHSPAIFTEGLDTFQAPRNSTIT